MVTEGGGFQMVVPSISPIDENSVIQGCLVGLGLLIAIYTLVYPSIKSRTESINKLKKLDDEFGIEYEAMPFELYGGFILTLGLFSIPLIIYILSFFGVQFISNILPYVLHFYFVGILLFILLFVLIFFRLNSFIRSDFDEKMAAARKATSKELEKVKVTHKKEFTYDAIITDRKK